MAGKLILCMTLASLGLASVGLAGCAQAPDTRPAGAAGPAGSDNAQTGPLFGGGVGGIGAPTPNGL